MATEWGKWISGMGEWHVFGGLTYDPGKHPSKPGNDVVRAHARRWLRDFSRGAAPRVEAAVVALEHHKSGWPHLHPLIRLRGGVQRGDFARLGQAWFTPHGYAKLEIPRDRLDVAAYAAKYLSKDLALGDVVFWPVRGSLSEHQPALGPGAAAGDADRGRRPLTATNVRARDPWSAAALLGEE